MLIWAGFATTALLSVLLVLRRPDRLSDLHIYYGAVAHLRAGGALYDYVAANGGPFTYPPFAALVLWPITVLRPGGAPRTIPLLSAYPGSRTFSFRSATMNHGRLVAHAADGRPLATYDDELAAALRGPTA
ncbi:hypothetical protein GA0074704_3673 [Micromonospora siamensis]|uniref:Uncharacterized protein n=2 Tax=Micromonospora siamensis TaxID=299152 RepID=A0A1C5IQM7_9ACTN|nr:hypothetical protein GA0074704_3673 [Micromonospora siamensis]